MPPINPEFISFFLLVLDTNARKLEVIKPQNVCSSAFDIAAAFATMCPRTNSLLALHLYTKTSRFQIWGKCPWKENIGHLFLSRLRKWISALFRLCRQRKALSCARNKAHKLGNSPNIRNSLIQGQISIINVYQLLKLFKHRLKPKYYHKWPDLRLKIFVLADQVCYLEGDIYR